MQLLEGTLELGQLVNHLLLSYLGAKRPVAGCLICPRRMATPLFHNGQRQFLVKFLGGKQKGVFFDPSSFETSLSLRVQGPVL